MAKNYKMDSSDHPTLRLVVVTRHRLDGDALAALLHDHADVRVLCTTTSTNVATVVCRHRRPDVVVIEASLVDNDARHSIHSLIRQMGEIPVLLLDDELNRGRLAAVLDIPHLGYFTRDTPPAELVDGIRKLVRGDRVIDPAVQNQVVETGDGFRLRHETHSSPLANLTAREMEVLRLIALGNTVKDCAEILDLAPSTVDNHKARLMKKLGIHKSLDLTRLAIREGLIRI